MESNFFSLLPTSIQKLSPYQAGKSIEEVQALAPEHSVIKLASNENPLGSSPKAIKAALNALNQSHRYPDSRGLKLKQALSTKHLCPIEKILLGAGSDEIFNLLVQCFSSESRPVYYSEYAFAAYPITAKAMCRPLVEIPAKQFSLDIEALILKANQQPGLIFIANPNNPTASYITQQSLNELLNALSVDNIVVIDEAYYDYLTTQPDYPDSIQLQKKHPNLVTLRTFSKAYGLAGFRVGYAIADQAIIHSLNRVRKPFNVCALSMQAALAALDDKAHLETTLALNIQGRQQLQDCFDQLGLDYLPSFANFITVKFGHQSQHIFELLLNQGIILRPLSPYKMTDYLRITIGLPDENQRLIEALNEQLAKG